MTLMPGNDGGFWKALKKSLIDLPALSSLTPINSVLDKMATGRGMLPGLHLDADQFADLVTEEAAQGMRQQGIHYNAGLITRLTQHLGEISK